MEEEEKRQLEEELKQPWVELEDPRVDEKALEPDFYVDRPPTPEFIPNPSGVDKETQIEDHELFDFELEVEPILEVLVGKALEQGRIEALEEWEQVELKKHKQDYADIREAELMEVQRLEAAYNRRVEETRRRKLQQEAHTQLKVQTQQKLLARLISRGLLSHVKQSSIKLLEDAGVLRDPKEQDLHSIYLPHLLGVAEEHLAEQLKEKPIISEMLDGMLDLIAKEHRGAIVDEYKKRLKKHQQNEERKAAEIMESRRRKDEREKLREQKRLDELKAKIEEQVVSKHVQVEDPTAAKIVDLIVGEKDKYLYTIGGLLGEILLTMIKVYELLSMSNPDFKLSPEAVENSIKGIAEAFIKSETSIDISLLHECDFATKGEVLSPDDVASPGLKYILEKAEKVGLNVEVLNNLLLGIIRFKTKKLEEPKELVPEIEVSEEKLNEMPEEERGKEKERIGKENEEIKKQNAEIKAKNEEIEKENSFISQLQAKIKVLINPEMPERGKLCAIACIGPMSGPPTPKANLAPHGLENPDLNSSKRNQKSQPILAVQKHLCVSNVVDDMRVIVVNKSISQFTQHFAQTSSQGSGRRQFPQQRGYCQNSRRSSRTKSWRGLRKSTQSLRLDY
eukprot:TRINITY_DN70851_c3_g1_i1.p1 TRINITY_DN70851_c3_g1~~TRINITY_DN70851_c3_g1_i1.p1  ORF type:complete len:622 (-),score=115.82 TRINITY_DN70851_c3_g1_i1:2919-4784(-)